MLRQKVVPNALTPGQYVEVTKIGATPRTNADPYWLYPASKVVKDLHSGLVQTVGEKWFVLANEKGLYRYPLGSKTKELGKVEQRSIMRGIIKMLRSTSGEALFAKGGGINLGSDPEIMVTNAKGVVIPAWKFLPGKDAQQNHHEEFAFWDGVQAEFTTLPDSCLAYHVDSIQAGLGLVLEAARAKFKDAKLSCAPVVKVPKDILAKASEHFVALGCAPSQNAYGTPPIHVENPRELGIRFAGGHIHFGAKPKDYDATVKALDSILGVCSISLLEGLDDPLRRKFYGRAGEYRKPPHGLEYRVLPSAMLFHPAVTHLCFDLARQTFWASRNGISTLWILRNAEEAQRVVNEGDIDGARKIVKRNINYLRSALEAVYAATTASPAKSADGAIRLILEGARKFFPIDMEKNWHLTDGNWVEHSEGAKCNITGLKTLRGRAVTAK